MEAVGSISTMITLAPINAHVTEKMSPHTVTERVENVHLKFGYQFLVVSIFENLEVLKLPFLPFLGL